MLVLSRIVGEQIVINDDIVVKVVAIRGNKVRIGIEAPASVRVDRQEVHDRLAKSAPVGTTPIGTTLASDPGRSVPG
jgi:carbon storage regulator